MSSFPVLNYETERAAERGAEALPLLSMSLSDQPQHRYQLTVHQETISVLSRSFDPKADLIVLVVCGLAGIGKSTWLNTIALSLDPTLRSDPFPTGEEQFSITKGLLVYPKPLKLFQCEDSPQVMLCDMEGFDGLRKDVSNEDNRNLLKRTVFCGLMLSSRFCVHSNVRLQPSQMESLNDIYAMVRELQTYFKLEKPQIALIVGNTNSIANEQELKSQIRTQCNLSEDLYASLKVFPRGQLPEKFQGSHLTKDLLGSVYHELALRFMLSSMNYPKGRHGCNTRFRLSDFTELIANLQEAVNDEQFVRRYVSSIRVRLEELIRPKMEQHQEEFEKSVQTILHDEHRDREALGASLRQAKKEAWDQLITEIEGEFHITVCSIPELSKVLKAFEESLEKRVIMLLVQPSKSAVHPPVEQRLSSHCHSQPVSQYSNSQPSLEERLAASELPLSAQAALFSPQITGPLKKDGTPDMRFKVNRDFARQRSVDEFQQVEKRFALDDDSNRSSNPFIPLTKDGKPDMRYSINRAGKKEGKDVRLRGAK